MQMWCWKSGCLAELGSFRRDVSTDPAALAGQLAESQRHGHHQAERNPRTSLQRPGRTDYGKSDACVEGGLYVGYSANGGIPDGRC